MRAIFFGGPADAQERVVNGDQRFRMMRLPGGGTARYELMVRYEDTLLYAHQMSLYQVLDLLIAHYIDDV